MNDPAAVHDIAVEFGFDDLLSWEVDGHSIVAWIDVYGLHSPRQTCLKIETAEQAEELSGCLEQCEGHGLLWREDACLLYAARRLNVKPQPWAYSESPEINRLFDAIGG